MLQITFNVLKMFQRLVNDHRFCLSLFSEDEKIACLNKCLEIFCSHFQYITEESNKSHYVASVFLMWFVLQNIDVTTLINFIHKSIQV